MIQEALLVGIHFILLFLVLIIIYFVSRIFYILFSVYILKNIHDKQDIKILTLSTLTLLLLFGLSFFVPSLVIHLININANPEIISFNNHVLMEWDKQLFSSYLPFWMQSSNNEWRFIFDLFAPALILSYRLLTVAMCGVFFWLLITHHRQFYQMFWSVVLCLILSLPIWYTFPATTPRDAFWINQQNKDYGSEIQSALINYAPNNRLKSFLNREGFITIPDDTIPITSIPSMHIAWATVVLYFSWTIGWPLLLVVFPYYILNFTATMFTLQHYAVDTIAGVIVAIVAILLAKIIYPVKPVTKPTLTSIIQKDLATLKTWLSKNK